MPYLIFATIFFVCFVSTVYAFGFDTLVGIAFLAASSMLISVYLTFIWHIILPDFHQYKKIFLSNMQHTQESVLVKDTKLTDSNHLESRHFVDQGHSAVQGTRTDRNPLASTLVPVTSTDSVTENRTVQAAPSHNGSMNADSSKAMPVASGVNGALAMAASAHTHLSNAPASSSSQSPTMGLSPNAASNLSDTQTDATPTISSQSNSSPVASLQNSAAPSAGLSLPSHLTVVDSSNNDTTSSEDFYDEPLTTYVCYTMQRNTVYAGDRRVVWPLRKLPDLSQHHPFKFAKTYGPATHEQAAILPVVFLLDFYVADGKVNSLSFCTDSPFTSTLFMHFMTENRMVGHNCWISFTVVPLTPDVMI